jgi:hypothetical protein
MFKDKKWINAICIVIILSVMVYLFQDVFKANMNQYKTEMADEVTVQETIDLDAFIVRDEKYIDGTMDGTVVPLVSDGNRVARGDSVARVFAKEQDAADYAELNELVQVRDRYISLNGQTELSALDMEKLNADIDSYYTNMMKIINSRNYSELKDYVDRYENALTSKQVLKDGTIDLSEKITALDKRIATLEARKITPDNVEAPISGYYISNLDGYETAVSYADVKSVGVSAVDNALEQEPATVTGKLGKIVSSYKWYIIANIESKYAKIIEVGDTMKINLPEYGYDNVKVNVASISAEKDGKVAIALSCNVMNETYANMRTEKVELVISEHTGYKVKTNAIHTYVPKEETTKDAEENETEVSTTTATTQMQGEITVVYILRGSVMNARRVEVIHTDGEYSIVRTDSEPVMGIKPIRRYDEVIVKGRNLENGRSIG